MKKIIDEMTDMYVALKLLVNYLQPTKELMNEEFRMLLEKAEEAIKNAES